MKRIILTIVLAVLASVSAQAQLAITEAMSSAVTNSDYWELSNFGSAPIDLTGYKMADEGAGLGGAYSTPFDQLTIEPGESILFVQDSVNTDEQSVRDWWGPGLSNSVRIVFYHNYGMSKDGDGMSLWDTSDNLVDHVHVDVATTGSSFTYDPATGVFGILSSNGVNGAFTAALFGDVGSPGVTTGPVPLSITQQPTNLTVVSGSAATFTVAALGLPHPKFQWYFTNNLNIGGPLTGETGPSLVIPNALTNNAGKYFVAITNGVESIASSNAVLTVNPAPTPPGVQTAPRDMVAYVGQSVTFSVVAQGNPAPTYQWKHDNVDLPGQTTSQLTLNGVLTNDSGIYTVALTNSAGNTNASATFLVTPKPNLVITEVQSSENSGTNIIGDWWELSNLDGFSVDLFGYRWDDNSANLGVAYTITNHAIIHPGESVILIETSAPGLVTPDTFKAWWGESNLPPNLQVIVYQGNGLGLSGTSGDQVNVWNQAATVSTDPIGKVASLSFSSSPAGRTFVRDPDTGIFWGNSTQGLSTNGVNGAFTAAQYGDVGSPGWVTEPMLLTIVRNGSGFDLTWNSTTGRNYTVFYKNNLAAPAWTPLTSVMAAGVSTTVTDAGAPASRIYRLGATVH